MSQSQLKRRWLTSLGAIALLAVVGFGLLRRNWPTSADHDNSKADRNSPGKIRRTVTDSLELSPQTVEVMHLRTVLATVPRYSRMLRLRGSLVNDPNRLVHVHARFPGQVVELATMRGLRSQSKDSSLTSAHTLQTFDTVVSGAPLAVIWSKNLGEIKTQLAEELAKLRLERKTLEIYADLTAKGSLSPREYREQHAKVELGEIAVFSAEAALRSFQVTEQEIEGVKAASELIHRRQQSGMQFGDWARVTVSAPISGVIVDKLVTVGEIVDANADLFKIADLSVMYVYLHAYEEDLSAIQKMPSPLPVAIKVPANPEIGELQGQINLIGPIIDPSEHMALLIGSVNNPENPSQPGERQLRIGQFITGEIGLPAQTGVVEIPSNALIDVGDDAVVYVQPDRSKPRFERRSVLVVQRHFDFVQVRSELTAEQKQLGLHEIHADEPVVSGGVLELEDYLSQL
jgi:membrane fusion protein, heavy metal efflux system